ncbi:MAG: universal stress protein [Thermoanaerobaculia bacterium]|nr:universal stress protein [Thermoanaerobaculia bacterium]
MTERMTIRHLLVATDFSEPAAAAVDYAAFLAARLEARVTMVHALEFSPWSADARQSDTALAGREEGARFVRELLEKVHSTRLRGVRTHTRLVTEGRAADAILLASRSSASDMIVLGTHGHGRLVTSLIGSVAAEVIRNADQPVLTIRRAVVPNQSIQRILCPVNYSTAARRALDRALYFASAFDAELLALYFEEGEATDEAIESELERMRRWIGEVPLSVRLTCIAHRGEPGSQVSAFAKSHDIDLIVIGAQQTGDGTTTTIGSTTEALTRRAECPVLTVPTRAATAQRATTRQLVMTGGVG